MFTDRRRRKGEKAGMDNHHWGFQTLSRRCRPPGRPLHLLVPTHMPQFQKNTSTYCH